MTQPKINLTAQNLRLVTERIDTAMDLDMNSMDTRLVLTEYLNIVNKSMLVFHPERTEEILTTIEDMKNSYSIIRDMAVHKEEPLAMFIVHDTGLERIINDISVDEKYSNDIETFIEVTSDLSLRYESALAGKRLEDSCEPFGEQL